jgi:hypothetical protein
MSWFKHKPRPKTQPKLHPHHHSPIAEKLWEQTKINQLGLTEAEIQYKEPNKITHKVRREK